MAPPRGATDNPARASRNRGFAALASFDTTQLHSATFDNGGCSAQGWTAVALTTQEAEYWHVEGYAGLPFGPVAGSRSLWCGTRPGTDFILCSYQTLPGYGNNWDQRWCTKTCLSVAGGPTSGLDVSFLIRLDTEASYDWAELEYTTDCSGNSGWTRIDGGPAWSGVSDFSVDSSYAVGAGPVKVRLRFFSDSSWSDQDGLHSTDGAVHIDNLKAENLALEGFEDELLGATESNDWESCNVDDANYAGLFSGATLLQEDPCTVNLSCMWAFIVGSTATYACGGHPAQAAVPYGHGTGVYISNEIWSPTILLTGSGTGLNLEFDVYRDLPSDELVYYTWRARTIVNNCPTAWQGGNTIYWGENRDWYRHIANAGSQLNLTGATHVQVALGVVDLCWFWCGSVGGGQCHSHAPLFDNVSVYRVDMVGPHWSVRDRDTFQDTFASDGTVTGTARADAALDIRSPWSSSPSVTPGDSSVVLSLIDRTYSGTGTNTSGLSNDPTPSTFVGRHKTKKQVYMWVAVWPQGQANKSGPGLSEGPGGQANRYPYIAANDYVDAGGVTWTAVRADYTYTGTTATPGLGTGTQPIVNNRFNVDLNDNLFVPGDTICYFFGATSPGGTTYYSSNWELTESIADVAANPMEFTILPAGGANRGGQILYVDGTDGLGNQPYFDEAFLELGLADKIDRYDMREPLARANNGLASRVYDVENQLNGAYRAILWDTGALNKPLGDGLENSDWKQNDYQLLSNFLAEINHGSVSGGVYLCGDDLAEGFTTSGSPGSFKSTYMPHTVLSTNHMTAGFGVSPQGKHWPARMFGDDVVLFGGCPEYNDFDVLGASGSSRVEMSYLTSQSANGAVLSNVNGAARVVLSGFSFAFVRDDESDGLSDRSLHMDRIVSFLLDSPTVGAGPGLRNGLSQNYPNPFNPQTTIAYAIKQRGAVSLRVYDVAGALVRTLANETHDAGAHTVIWDGRNEAGKPVASGVYFYRLVAPGFAQTKKMVMLK